MRIGVVGGRERNTLTLARAAGARGHEVEVHDGDTSGRGVHEIRALVRRADLVIVLTDVNSHNAVHVARDAARRSGRPVALMRRLGLDSLRRAFADGEELDWIRNTSAA